MIHGRRRQVHAGSSVSFVRAANSWRSALIAGGRSRATLRSYSVTLRQYRDWLGRNGVAHPTLAHLDPEHVRGFLASIRARQRESSTIHTRCIGLKVFAGWCVNERMLRENPLSRLKNPKMKRKVSRPFSHDECAALVAAARASSLAARNVALLFLALSTGIRAGEIMDLTLDRLNVEERHLTVNGKGAKQRALSFDEATADALAEYLAVRSSGAAQVFVTATGQAMRGQTLYGIVARLGKAAGVRSARPHRMRDTYAVAYAASHVNDIMGLQSRLGHENVTQTLAYARQARTLTPLVGATVLETLGLC